MNYYTMLSTMNANLAKLGPEPIARLEASMVVDFQEHFDYQTLQSEAYASGKIPLDVAKFLFKTLGGSSDVFNSKPLGERMLALSMLNLLCR